MDCYAMKVFKFKNVSFFSLRDDFRSCVYLGEKNNNLINESIIEWQGRPSNLHYIIDFQTTAI